MWINRLIETIRLKKIIKNIRCLGGGCTFQSGFRIKGACYIEIGNNCYFGESCRIEAWDEYNDKTFKPSIVFGNNVHINSTCHIGAINLVKIGDDCLFGSHVLIIDHSHGRNDVKEMDIHPSERDLYSKGPIIIEERCWIAENAVILPNVHIGKCCVIGANSVVTKDIPDYSVAVGNPAVVVKTINRQ
jgi:acetyltransferase-like isoleucine patch superfamily enzyme